MKKIALITASLLMLVCLKVNAQNERVLLFECFTNTSCGPCAQQNPALDALIDANGERIAAIKYHMNWPGANDPMYLHNTADNNARRGVYNVSSVPHTVVDGIRFANVPGNLNQNMVNNWLNIESPIELRLGYELDTTSNTITVNVMGRVSSAIAGQCKLYVGVIEKEIHYTSAPGANGERDFYSVMKKLLPSSSGEYLGELAVDDYFAYSFSWEWANVYNVDQLDAIAWVQNQNTKEVYQACRSSQSLVPFYQNEAGLSNIDHVKSVSCSGLVEPVVDLCNFGSNPLTSAELEVLVNGEHVKNLSWTGNLQTYVSERVEIGEVSFPVEEENLIEVRIKSVNGGDDEAPKNDLVSYSFVGATEIVGKVLKLTIRTDSNPQQTTWKVKNMATGEVIQEGGPYSQANHNYSESLEIPATGCYDLTIFDEGGDGLVGGFYGLKAGSTTIFSGGEFADFESNEFAYQVTTGIDEAQDQTAQVYPNPTSEMLNIICKGVQKVALYNVVGQCVYEGVAEGWLQVDMNQYGSGIYAIQIGNETQRVVVK